jgi:hypothetical protein
MKKALLTLALIAATAITAHAGHPDNTSQRLIHAYIKGNVQAILFGPRLKELDPDEVYYDLMVSMLSQNENLVVADLRDELRSVG